MVTRVSRSGTKCRQQLRHPSSTARSNPTMVGGSGGTEMFLKGRADEGETRSLSDGGTAETSSTAVGDH